MNSFNSILFKAAFFPFKIIDSIYWNLWRGVQKSTFKKIGNSVWLGRHSFFHNKNITIGNDVFIGEYCRLQATKSCINIGSHVMLAPCVQIHGGDHRIDIIGRPIKSISESEKLPQNDLDVVIEDDVWIGACSIILKGVRIGKGSIIGANSVITNDVPSYSIVVGSKPQKILKRWSEAQIEEHENLLKRHKI
jgi:maltose O-acetyltransferase